ncbi:MAG: hypothetical protein Q4B96_01185 [Bacillota bacterium]|nr:hypothetical protein [Bacillota bacterium]
MLIAVMAMLLLFIWNYPLGLRVDYDGVWRCYWLIRICGGYRSRRLSVRTVDDDARRALDVWSAQRLLRMLPLLLRRAAILRFELRLGGSEYPAQAALLGGALRGALGAAYAGLGRKVTAADRFCVDVDFSASRTRLQCIAAVNVGNIIISGIRGGRSGKNGGTTDQGIDGNSDELTSANG